MSKYPHITYALRTIFGVDLGLPEDAAIRMYVRSTSDATRLAELREELVSAFNDTDLSWKGMLLDKDYEVLDANTEEEALAHAKRILWAPLFGHSPASA